jgi:hypothetical protein
MSTVIAEKTTLVPTIVGAFASKAQLIEDYDVDDIIRQRAIAQVRLIQLLNTGNQVAGTSGFPQDSLPVMLQQNTELTNA